MANFIVTCQKIGQALTNWIINIGTPEQKDALCKAIRDELGCGIVTSDTQSVDLSGSGNIYSPLSADVRISARTDNEIRVENDGLYVGAEAPADVAVLYVSPSSGNDGNAGARDNPLATLEEAVRRQGGAPGSYHVYLKCGDTFSPTTILDWAQATTLVVSYYGDPVYPDYDEAEASDCYFYRPATGAELTRPVIVIGSRRNDEVSPPVLDWTTLAAQGRMFLHGLELRLEAPAIPGTTFRGGRMIRAGVEVGLRGCILRRQGAGDADGLIDTPRLRVDQSRLQLDTFAAGTTLLYSANGNMSSLSTAALAGSPDGCGRYPSYSLLVGNVAQVRAQLTLGNAANGLIYDSNTKSLFGLTVDWDIFATTRSAQPGLMQRLLGGEKE